MGLGPPRSRSKTRVTALGALLLVLTAMQGWSVVALADPNATITGSFSDSCRDFEAHSSKDIGYVEVHYADGRVVKDESVDSPDYSIDGGTGDEIAFAIVKSGRTRERFDCDSNSPPVAVLEAKTREGSWATGGVRYACDETCLTATFRGTSSTDPDNDIMSWSIDFGDHSPLSSGTWTTDPPAEVTHHFPDGGVYSVVLRVIDSEGQSSDARIFAEMDDDASD